MKKLPIGIQDFGKLREGGFVYVDKTELIYQLTQGGGYYRPAARFLSRPRRFGKSLLVSTLAELFRGHQTLFEGLWMTLSRQKRTARCLKTSTLSLNHWILIYVSCCLRG